MQYHFDMLLDYNLHVQLFFVYYILHVYIVRFVLLDYNHLNVYEYYLPVFYIWVVWGFFRSKKQHYYWSEWLVREKSNYILINTMCSRNNPTTINQCTTTGNFLIQKLMFNNCNLPWILAESSIFTANNFCISCQHYTTAF